VTDPGPFQPWVDAVAAYITFADHAFREGMTLVRGVMELGEVEDPSLGVFSTTVYFPALVTGNLQVENAVIRATGQLLKIDILSLAPVRGRTSTRVGVRLRLPRGTSFAVCGFTLNDGRGTRRDYVLPFGVPAAAPQPP